MTIVDAGPFFHGTKADLRVGDLLTAGFKSNYDATVVMNPIYFTRLPPFEPLPLTDVDTQEKS